MFQFTRCMAVVASLMFFSCQASDSLRCGNYVVAVGDPTAELLVKCGQPVLAEEGASRSSGRFHHRARHRQTIWTYDMGYGHFLQIVVIEDGAVREIRNGPRR
jgi:hypothetical protein